jgi:hypothetical protein
VSERGPQGPARSSDHDPDQGSVQDTTLGADSGLGAAQNVATVDPRDSAPRLFLERRSYTERRRIDALRLLPFVACFLWLVPLAWRSGTGAGADVQPAEATGAVTGMATGAATGAATLTSSASLYLFVVWALLIIAGFYLARRVPKAQDATRAGYFYAPAEAAFGAGGNPGDTARAEPVASDAVPSRSGSSQAAPAKAPKQGSRPWDS